MAKIENRHTKVLNTCLNSNSEFLNYGWWDDIWFHGTEYVSIISMPGTFIGLQLQVQIHTYLLRSHLGVKIKYICMYIYITDLQLEKFGTQNTWNNECGNICHWLVTLHHCIFSVTRGSTIMFVFRFEHYIHQSLLVGAEE